MLAHKIELKPNNAQITYFKKACGVSRLAWNWALAQWDKEYKEGLKPNALQLKKSFNAIKKEQFPFVYEVTKYAAQQPFIQLQDAFKRFFKKVAQRPKFKKKHRCKDSFYIGGDQLKLQDDKVHIPNLGLVRLKETLRYEGKILNGTVSRTANKWFISLVIEPSQNYITPCESQASVGVDLGIRHFAVLSDGTFIDSPNPLRKFLRKLQRQTRQLSKKQHSRKKGDTTPTSQNYRKYSARIAKLHMKIVNCRKDFLHKVTSFLANNFKYISIEDLNVKGMMSNRKLSRAIADIGMYEFKRQLEYKTKSKGSSLLINDRWFPSSKKCPHCGHKKTDLTLSDRVYFCDNCKIQADRDYIAAINLHNELVRQVLPELTPVEITAMRQKASLLDVTSIVETGSKRHTYI